MSSRSNHPIPSTSTSHPNPTSPQLPLGGVKDDKSSTSSSHNIALQSEQHKKRTLAEFQKDVRKMRRLHRDDPATTNGNDGSVPAPTIADRDDVKLVTNDEDKVHVGSYDDPTKKPRSSPHPARLSSSTSSQPFSSLPLPPALTTTTTILTAETLATLSVADGVEKKKLTSEYSSLSYASLSPPTKLVVAASPPSIPIMPVSNTGQQQVVTLDWMKPKMDQEVDEEEEQQEEEEEGGFFALPPSSQKRTADEDMLARHEYPEAHDYDQFEAEEEEESQLNAKDLLAEFMKAEQMAKKNRATKPRSRTIEVVVEPVREVSEEKFVEEVEKAESEPVKETDAGKGKGRAPRSDSEESEQKEGINDEKEEENKEEIPAPARRRSNRQPKPRISRDSSDEAQALLSDSSSSSIPTPAKKKQRRVVAATPARKKRVEKKRAAEIDFDTEDLLGDLPKRRRKIVKLSSDSEEQDSAREDEEEEVTQMEEDEITDYSSPDSYVLIRLQSIPPRGPH